MTQLHCTLSYPNDYEIEIIAFIDKARVGIMRLWCFSKVIAIRMIEVWDKERMEAVTTAMVKFLLNHSNITHREVRAYFVSPSLLQVLLSLGFVSEDDNYPDEGLVYHDMITSC